MKFRGHHIEDKDDVFVYSDTLEPVAENWQKRGCGHCGMKDTPEGHDGCLGTLDENIVMNACCGHGNDSEAYVQFWNGDVLTGDWAIDLQKELKTAK
tara:strand:- start:12845 stop:13135 length:291 start_codon:yes stop_codon:yes gene_type:complete